ncbi:MAG: hypothetical protein ACYC5N_02740 [Endomicrobiales bacterium]
MEERKNFVIDGREYHSLEEVPEQYRELVRRAEQNPGKGVHVTFHRSFKFKVNGKEYDRAEDLPEAARKLLEDKDRDGIPDALEGLIPKDAGNAPSPAPAARDGEPSPPSLIREDPSNRYLLLVPAFAAAGFLAYYFFLK